jgi:CRP-like cAMP-binding protein
MRVDPYVATLLEKITVGKLELSFRRGEKIFSQGDRADSIHFIQTGRSPSFSAAGREAVLATPAPHVFFGEGSLVNQFFRISTAETLEPLFKATRYSRYEEEETIDDNHSRKWP